MLQLLSSGAFASSVDENNRISCFAPNPSNTTRTGSWTAKVANTDIAGTVQTVLFSDVAVGTSASSGPAYTWIPYVSAAGNYDINLLVPGCTNFQDCARRTSVQVVVFPGEGLPPNVMTISQRNTDDASVLIYSGPILPSSPNFVATVTMSLADNPEGTGQGGRFDIIADRVQLILRSANIDGTTAGNSSTTSVGGQRGFGFLEWPRSSSVTADGTSSLPNSTITPLDSVGFELLAGIGGTAGLATTPLSINAVVHHPSGAIFFGGSFSLTAGAASGATNILAFRDGALTGLAEGGLDGPVTSLVLVGDSLFIGGSFTDTRTGTTGGRLRGVAMYDVARNTWNALGAGVNGEVVDLVFHEGRVQLAGSFTQIESADGDATGFGTSAPGIASWDVAEGRWVASGGFTSGRITMIVNGTSDDQQFVAGNVAAARKFGASGMIMLKNGEDGTPQVSPIASPLGASRANVARAAVSSPAATIANRRRGHGTSSSWISRSVRRLLMKRQSPAAAPLAALPPSPPAPAPAVLAGTFWENDGKQLTVVGGNFSFVPTGATALSQAVAIYDPESGLLRGLSGAQLAGTVRAILLDGERLYVGGEFTMADTSVNAFAIYNLASNEWDLGGLQPLQGAGGAVPVVRSITKSSAGVVVAGSFAQAGELRCVGVCVLDVGSKQWNTLGGGVQGEVASVVYAGVSQLRSNCVWGLRG